jgi:hypothetical protein
MANTKKLCAVVLSTLGREVMVRRPCVIGDDGWPAHPDPFNITAGQVRATVAVGLPAAFLAQQGLPAHASVISSR